MNRTSTTGGSSQRTSRYPRLRTGIAILGLIAAVVLAYQASYWLRIRDLATQVPDASALMMLRIDQQPGLDISYQWVPYERISPWLRRSVIAAEDTRFMQHRGIDWEAVQGAAAHNRRAGRIVAGGSTITQQLARTLFLSPQRTYLRKAQEAILALMMAQSLTKRRILELYLNMAEWGDGIFGAEAAALHYFGTPAATLEPDQAAMLAVRLPRPRHHDRLGPTPELRDRARKLLRRAVLIRPPDAWEPSAGSHPE